MSDTPKSCGVGGRAIGQIWKAYRSSRSEALRNELVEHYLHIVKYHADRISRRLPSAVDVDDLAGAGVFGLMDAIDSYDPGRGVKFETYCAQRVSGAILDELRSLDWAPRLVRSRAAQLDRTRRSLEKQHGRAPTEEELADALDVDRDEFDRIRRDARKVAVTSLSRQRYRNDSDREMSEIEFLQDQTQADPLSVAQRRDLKQWLTRHLSRAERLVVILYYFERLTMKEIGVSLDMSESRVSQLHSSIIARLKARHARRTDELASVLSDSD